MCCCKVACAATKAKHNNCSIATLLGYTFLPRRLRVGRTPHMMPHLCALGTTRRLPSVDLPLRHECDDVALALGPVWRNWADMYV